MELPHITVRTLQAKKKEKTPLVALTCYDAATSFLIDPYVDVALVGDSLANTRLGYNDTIPVTIEEMLHHTKAAARGNHHALLVADMPFQSYEVAPWQAAFSAGRFIKEAGAQAVKLEGGGRVAASVKAIVQANIPVMGHLGLMPQAIHKEGGYVVKGRTPKEAQALLKEALLLERLGVFAIVLEGIPATLAQKITKALRIPTLGIGAGPHCDGQILVLDDVLGFSNRKAPKFVKAYANLSQVMNKALAEFSSDVKEKKFPSIEHSYSA